MARDRGVSMTTDGVVELLDEQRTLTLATIGPDGMPHLAGMWFVREDTADGAGTDLIMWTYRSSQKARNLRRDPRASVLAECGEAYDQLRGVCLDCRVELIDGSDEVYVIGRALFEKYLAVPGMDAVALEAAEAGLRAQATKRVGMRLRTGRARSWDHRKLAH